MEPCTKRAYASKAAAKRAIKHTQTRISGATTKRAYRCDRCGQWHTTSEPARRAA